MTGAANTTHLGLEDPLEHWWIIVETFHSWYVIQFYKDVYTMV
jgi:hypothetical protein